MSSGLRWGAGLYSGAPPVQRPSSGRGRGELSDEQGSCRGWRVRGQGDKMGLALVSSPRMIQRLDEIYKVEASNESKLAF